jgi:tape measure domain-containing protein
MAGRTVLDEVVEKFSADPSDYIAGTKKVIDASRSVAAAHAKSFMNAGSAVQGFGSQVSSALSPLRAMGLAAAAGITGLALAGAAAFKEFAGFDSLVKALEAVEGNAGRAQAALADLKEIAKAPGLGFGEAVGGFLQLRRAGLSGGASRSLVQEAGNANALGGGSAENLSSILRALSQIALKPFASQEEMLQLSEAGVNASGMIKKKFGTADTEELKKAGITSSQVLQALLDSMKELPRVAGGAQNTLDNLAGAIKFMMVSVGGAIASFATGPIEAISSAIESATDSGIFTTAIESFGTSLGLIGDGAFTAEGAVLGLAAGFMTLGAHMDIFRGNIEGLIELFRSMAKFSVSLGPLTYGFRKLIGAIGFDVEGFAKGKSGLDPAGTGVDFFTMYTQQLEQQVAASKKKKKPQAEKLTDDIAGGTGTEAKPGLKPVDLLQRIADNTDPLKEIASQVLGGGALAGRGLSRQELGDLRSGRTGSPWERVSEALKKAVMEEAIRMSGIQVSRREF